MVPPAVTDDDANDTLTVATGTAVTVSSALPLLPSLVPVIVAVPTVSVVTRPLALTVATAGFELAHDTARPVSTSFEASREVAVACVVPPTVIDEAASDTLTVATGTGTTVTVDDPTTPSAVALITVVPGATARTRPVLAMTATLLFAERHSTARSVNTAPLLSRTTAVRSSVTPVISETLTGVTSTRITADNRTVTAALASRPSLDANTSPEPGPTAVTVPSGRTVNTLGAPEVQVIGRCASVAPPASKATADNRVPLPTNKIVVAGKIRIDDTGDGETTTVAVPTCPSLVTVIVATPGAFAVTVPSAATWATDVLLMVNADGRPTRSVPLASVICTTSRTVCPTVSAD